MNNPVKINEHIILIYGLGNVPNDRGLSHCKDVSLIVNGNVQKVEDIDNNDGTIDRKYKIKIISVEVK